MRGTLRLPTGRMINGRTIATLPGCEFNVETGIVFVPDHRPNRPPGAGTYMQLGAGTFEPDLEVLRLAAEKAAEKKGSKAA